MCGPEMEETKYRPEPGVFKELRPDLRVQAYVWREGIGYSMPMVLIVQVPAAKSDGVRLLFQQVRFEGQAKLIRRHKPQEGPSAVFLEAPAGDVHVTLSSGIEVPLLSFMKMAAMGETEVTQLFGAGEDEGDDTEEDFDDVDDDDEDEDEDE